MNLTPNPTQNPTNVGEASSSNQDDASNDQISVTAPSSSMVTAGHSEQPNVVTTATVPADTLVDWLFQGVATTKKDCHVKWGRRTRNHKDSPYMRCRATSTPGQLQEGEQSDMELT